jgi:hypothetical protein
MDKRADYGKNTDEWFANVDEAIAPIALELHSIIKNAVPDVTVCIKWGTPNYEKNGPVCSIRTGKGFVALQFGSIGTSLEDPDGLLEGTGKAMRHVKIRLKANLKKRQFTTWIQLAAKANLNNKG